MNKKIVVCLDGTWNTNEQNGKRGSGPTNVLKLYQSVDQRLQTQKAFHVNGVGSGLGQRLRGGAFGHGLFEQIKHGYDRIVDCYEPGDEIFLFGFSRGAYSARSLAGFIARCGVLKREALEEVKSMPLPFDELPKTDQDDIAKLPATATDKAFVMYKLAYMAARHPQIELFKAKYAHDTDIAMVGVWDTVGSLGLPTTRFLAQLRGRLLHPNDRRFGFLDTGLSDRVMAAYHALAIDEFREPFRPTLWESPRVNQPGSNVEQVWFAGAHSNVGGGYAGNGLSDIALGWMVERAKRHGLRFMQDPPQGNPTDKLNDSLSEFLGGVLKPFIRRTRHIAAGSSIHRSVEQRLAREPEYQPDALLTTDSSHPKVDLNRYTIV